jgi:antitoxin component YwqK of YwqJK toxin-antitoxin module
MLEKKNYVNGQEIYKKDDNRLKYFYKSGQLKAEGLFENNQMEGEWRFYRESGQLWQIGNFKHNMKHGLWIRYNKENQQEYCESFENGKLVKLR